MLTDNPVIYVNVK